MGAILEPCWPHFCSMFGLRSLLDTHLYQKRRCSRKPLKTNEKSTFLTPRRLGNQAQINPRRLQEVILFAFKPGLAVNGKRRIEFAILFATPKYVKLIFSFVFILFSYYFYFMNIFFFFLFLNVFLL